MKTRFDRILDKPKTPKKAKPSKEPEPPPLSFEEKVQNDFYHTKLPYPTNRKDPNYLTQRRAYTADNDRLYREFKQDLFAEHGVTHHPKAETAFRLAWDQGHSDGLSSVANHFSELADLLKPEPTHGDRAPTQLTLVQTYLQAHFPGVPAAVFFDPLGDGLRPRMIADLAQDTDVPSIINAGIYILPRLADTLAGFVNHLPEDAYGFVMGWDGSKFITENT